MRRSGAKPIAGRCGVCGEEPEALGAAVDLARDAGRGTVRELDMAGEEIASLPVGGRRR